MGLAFLWPGAGSTFRIMDDQPSIYRGAAVAVILQWTMRLIGLVSVIILARLLGPADFGIVGLAAAALSLVELIGAVGLRQALLRIRTPSREHLDTAFTIQLILMSAMALAGIASAPFIGAVYKEPALTAVVAALSCRYFLLGLVNIGIVDFDRHLQFGKDLRMRLVSRLAAFAVTLAAAILLQSYWALVIGLICQSGFHAVASWVVHPYRPRLSLSRRSELLGFSLWMFIHYTAQTVQQQVERLALGRFATAHLVGLYSVSKDLSDIFTQEISTALDRVTFVTVARSGGPLSDSPERLPGLIGAYAMIAAPMGLGLAATAEPTITVLLGRQWVDAVPLLQIVAVYSAIYAVYQVIASALMASGKGRMGATLSGAGAMVLIFAVASASLARPDAMSIAWAAFAGNAVVLLAGTLVIAREAQARLSLLIASIIRPFLAAAMMAAAVHGLVPEAGMALLDLIACVAIGCLLYPVLLAAIWLASGRPAGAESEALRLVSDFGGRLRPRFR